MPNFVLPEKRWTLWWSCSTAISTNKNPAIPPKKAPRSSGAFFHTQKALKLVGLGGGMELEGEEERGAMRLMVVPLTTPRDRTPRRLLAFTLRSSFSTQMELLNSLAFWMKKVAGRA